VNRWARIRNFRSSTIIKTTRSWQRLENVGGGLRACKLHLRPKRQNEVGDGQRTAERNVGEGLPGNVRGMYPRERKEEGKKSLSSAKRGGSTRCLPKMGRGLAARGIEDTETITEMGPQISPRRRQPHPSRRGISRTRGKV